ncbi:MAG: porphobilinogen synthase, partial [Alphaproteobacteria bacterium]
MSNRITAAFPAARPRRLRATPWVRDLVRENNLTPADLLWPIFVRDGENEREPIQTMAGVDRLSVDLAAKAAVEAQAMGIPVIALFPYTDPALRDETGSEAHNSDNLVCRAVRAIKEAAPNIGVMCDVALDPYTTHGHD